jgi:hypothetical protein
MYLHEGAFNIFGITGSDLSTPAAQREGIFAILWQNVNTLRY